MMWCWPVGIPLYRYSQLLTYDVEVRSGMEEVKHERSQCTCPAYAYVISNIKSHAWSPASGHWLVLKWLVVP
jgi:hypothetical protein